MLKGAQVAIPNDVSNQARALKLLESAGLIKLKKNFGLNGTTKDIESNPKDLKLKLLMHNKQRVHFLMWIYQLSITVLQQKQEKTLKGSYLFKSKFRCSKTIY